MSQKKEPTITVKIDRMPQHSRLLMYRIGAYGTAVIEGTEEFPVTIDWRIDAYDNPTQRARIAQELDADPIDGPRAETGEERDYSTQERLVTKPSRKYLNKLFVPLKKEILDAIERSRQQETANNLKAARQREKDDEKTITDYAIEVDSRESITEVQNGHCRTIYSRTYRGTLVVDGQRVSWRYEYRGMSCGSELDHPRWAQREDAERIKSGINRAILANSHRLFASRPEEPSAQNGSGDEEQAVMSQISIA
jgi:hypothetical protein